MREGLEAAVETLPRLERQVAAAQDSLEEEDKLQRVRLSQRPKSKFSDFHGEPQEWKVFLGDTKEIYELFKDPQQRILQIAGICPDQVIKDKVMAYSGSGPEGPDKAIAALKSEYGDQHLNKPVLLQRLKDTATASGPTGISTTCNLVISNLEALSNLGGPDQVVPQYVLCNIFRALKLSQDEKISIMPLMERETGVTLGEIREYTKKRHSTFSLYERTLQKAEKEYRETHKVKPFMSGSSAFTDNQTPPNPEGGGHGRGKGSKKRQNRVLGASASHGNKDDGGQGRGINGKKQEEN